jgi:hypothetical protein
MGQTYADGKEYASACGDTDDRRLNGEDVGEMLSMGDSPSLEGLLMLNR